MRKFAKVFAGLIVFLTMLSMGVQQVTSFAMMSSGPLLPGQQRGVESLPVWGRWAVGAVALTVAVVGARKMLRSSRTPPQLQPSKAPTFERSEP